MRWSAVVHALVLAAFAATAGCHGRGQSEEEAPPKGRVDESGNIVLTGPEQDAIGLAISAVESGTLTTKTLRFGTVVARPQEDALVIAPVAGRLQAPLAELGAAVEKGAPLVVVEPLVDAASRATLESERRQLLGRIEGAEAEVKAKQANLDRVTTLVTNRLATEAERVQAEAALRSEQARAESLRRASVELDQVTGGTMTLRAPAIGTLAALAAGTGSLVQQGTVLARIVRTGPRWIDVAVPPGDPVGESYRLRGQLGEWNAQLLTRGSVVHRDGTRRDRLLADPVAAPSLPPGATVAVEVLSNHSGVLVAVEAIVRRGEERLVFVEVEAGCFAPRTVTVGAQESVRAVITSGVTQGDRVVTRGSASLLGELGAGRKVENAR